MSRTSTLTSVAGPRRLAERRGWAFVDPWAGMRVDGVWPDGLSFDGIHPTADAAKVAGEVISGAICQLAGDAG